MGAGPWLLLAWGVMFALSCPSAWPLPARSLPGVPPRALLRPGRAQRRAAWREAMERGDLGPPCPYGAVRLFVGDLAPPGARPKGTPDSTLSYSRLPALRTSPGAVRSECCYPSSPPPGKGSGAIGTCCEDKNCAAFRGRPGRLQRKRHLPSQPGNSSEVEAEADGTVGPSPSREATPRSRVEVVKMTAKGAMKDRGVVLALSGLAAAVSVLLLAGGALLVRQRCGNAAV